MRNTFSVCVVMLLWGLASSAADASFCPPVCYCPCPPPPCCVAYVTRSVTCYRTEWKEEKVPVVIQKVSYTVKTTKVKETVYVAKYFDEQVTTSYFVPVTRIVEYDKQFCVMVPVVVFDPCTCCCYTTCYPQWVSRKVQCPVVDTVQKSRVDVVKVCKYVPEDRIVDRTEYIPVITQEKSFTVRRYCVTIPYETKVYVPVYVPCCP
jgi:hypothetical protein